MDYAHRTIRKLSEIDSRLSKLFHKVSQVQINCKSSTPGIGLWFDKTFATGSLQEGAFWAKCFGLHTVVRILEADFMSPIGQIEDAEITLVPLDHTPGFYKLTTDDLLHSMHHDVRNRYEEWQADPQNQNKDVCQSSVLKFIKSLFFGTETKNEASQMVADILLQPAEPSKAEATFSIDGPSALTVIKLTSASDYLIEVRLDTVPCLELSLWPDQSKCNLWLNRQRKWPSRELVFEVQRLVCVVAKAPQNPQNEIETNNVWRLSFSKAEMLFVSTYSDNQRDIYYIFKIMFYANIKKIEIGGKRIPSYFCKTTMLWMMEEEGEEFGEGDFEQAIRMLYGKLNQFLGNRYLPNFFDPSVNLLDGYPEHLITTCSDMIKKLIESPVDYVPSILNDEYEFLKIVWKRLNDLKVECFLDAVINLVASNFTNGRDAFEVFSNLFNSGQQPGM